MQNKTGYKIHMAGYNTTYNYTRMHNSLYINNNQLYIIMHLCIILTVLPVYNNKY